MYGKRIYRVMSSEAAESTVVSPYRGVLPFRYADRSLFFGREKVIENLYAKILLYRLVLLFGQSGAGKSSVINAGVIPALQNEGCQAERLRVSPEYENAPILIERIEGDAGTSETFLPSIFLAEQTDTTKALERIPLAVDEFFNALRRAPHGPIPLLIFDQFEELFTLFSPKGDDKDRLKMLAQSQILEAINELAHDEKLEVKILIIIREDFLGKLEVFARKYPQIFDHRVRLGHLDKKDAKLAIIGPFMKRDSFNSKISENLADTIVDDLSGHEDQGVVPATQLQIVCDRLYRRYSNRPEITQKEFAAEGKIKGLLEGYLNSEIEKLEVSRRPQAIRILANLITDSNTRDVVSEDKLKSILASKSSKHMDTLSNTLETLEKRRIINRATQRGIPFYEVASEYLIDPIKREKQRLLSNIRLKQQRNRWIGGVTAALVSGAVAFSLHSIWIERQPWAYMTNLSTGTIYDLKGSLVGIGRSNEDFKNQIELLPREISRIHLFLSRQRAAIDMRSLNGTTVNAQFLPYGKAGKLSAGDVVTLAGIAPFLFSTSPNQVLPPSSAWAMVIDGKARAHYYLSSDRYVLALIPEKSIVVTDGSDAKGQLSIEKTNKGIVIVDTADDHDLKVEMRLGDYTYVSCKVPPGKLFNYLDVRELHQYQPCDVLTGRSDLKDATRLEHNLFTVTYKYGDTAFQLVLIVSGLEASAPVS
jgi:hypothetical protein